MELRKYNVLEGYTRNDNILTDGKVRFEVNVNYPFHPPRVYFTKQDMEERYGKRLFRYKNLLEVFGVTNYGCFHCMSITCADNWRASYGLIDILNELDKFYSVVKGVIEWRISKSLFQKSGYVDIDLMKYLVPDI